MNNLFSIALLLIIGCKSNKNISSKEWHISDSLTRRSKLLLQENKLDSAKLIIYEALKLDPNNYEAYNNRAYLKNVENAAPAEVIADYKESIRLKSDYDVAIYSLANYYHSIQDWQNTKTWTDKYLKLITHKETDSLISNIYRIRRDAVQSLSKE